MKQTVNYLILEASKNNREAIDKITKLNSNIVAEKEKYFILKDE